jgi:alpha-amylase/alpha-mannosidase (GH57 family)
VNTGSEPARLSVVLLWHMHQPQYRDALTGQYVLPWTYLHAIKDYVDMAAHLEAAPSARAVVNFTPVLIEQLEEIAGRIAEHLDSGAALPDPVLALLGPSEVPQASAERLELLRTCLRAQRKNMIERFAPYLELATLAETFATPARIGYASDQFMHDLAVWYHLAWLGETVRRSDPLVAALTAQGRAFTLANRRELLALVGRLVGSIIPRFRALSDAGQCELSLTPYAHPIVPLLIDFTAARQAQPTAPLPRHGPYPGGAERAAWHMREGIRVFTAAFGRRPVGCWPSEGAISQETLELIEQFEFRWTASSTNVLRASLLLSSDPSRSLDHHDFNRPYRLDNARLSCFFRDDELSDLIGFSYATWRGDDAAAHFVQELVGLASRLDGAPGHAVLIALDGENAWEHYPFNGYFFLSALYAALAAHPALELTTLSQCTARGLVPATLAQVVAGSWVHGTLATWMGDAAKNAAWELLCEAKRAFDRASFDGETGRTQRSAAERQLALCESSDWFWWFGDYNPEDAVTQFDRLYRRQLVNLYRILQLAPPENLSHPLSVGRGAPEHGGAMRRATAG